MRRIDAKTATQMLRDELKAAFPNIKFSIRRSSWTIRISYLDGVPSRQVDAIVRKYSGTGFDGMTDSTYHYHHAITQDGKLISLGSRHYELKDAPEGSESVSLDTDYVFVSRQYSRPALELAKAQHVDLTGLEIADNQDGTAYFVEHTVPVAHGIIQGITFANGAIADWNG